MKIISKIKNTFRPNADSFEDPFLLQQRLVDAVYGPSHDIVVGRVSDDLLEELLANFGDDSSFASDFSSTDWDPHPCLKVDHYSPEVLEKLSSSITPGILHQFCYSNETVSRLHDELRKMFSAYIASPFVFVNTRIWKSKPGLRRYGPNDWHYDGFAPGHMKIMLYLTPLNKDFGLFLYKDKKGVVHQLDNSPAGTAVCFKNSDIEHSGVPGASQERISIEVTLMRSLVDGQQEWPGHFFGRHFQSLRQSQRLAATGDMFSLSKKFSTTQHIDGLKVNVGSGVRNWDGWVCLDELHAPGVTNISFSETSEFPLEDDSVSLFYSSHFFEHISDAVVSQTLREMQRCALPGALFVLKLPNFSWFLEQYRYHIDDSVVGKGIEKVLWSWPANGVADNFENRLAMMFCAYWNKSYGDHFSKNINNNQFAYHGPPQVNNSQLQDMLSNHSPHQISKILSSVAINDDLFQSFNHRNAWSNEEMLILLQEHDIKVIQTNKDLILDMFLDIIPDINSMHKWSSFYLCQFSDET